MAPSNLDNNFALTKRYQFFRKARASLCIYFVKANLMVFEKCIIYLHIAFEPCHKSRRNLSCPKDAFSMAQFQLSLL